MPTAVYKHRGGDCIQLWNLSRKIECVDNLNQTRITFLRCPFCMHEGLTDVSMPTMGIYYKHATIISLPSSIHGISIYSVIMMNFIPTQYI